MTQPTTVVFDIGGVLLDWDPRYLFRKIFDDEQEMEYFLMHVCSHTWNLLQDAGRAPAEGIAELRARYPQYAEQISAYYTRWLETLGDVIHDSVAILRQLQAQNTPLYAITNFNQDTFALCLERYDFLNEFLGIVVSGEVKLLKPDPAIYLRLLQEHKLNAADCVFIDDNEANAKGAQRVGMHGIHFQSPAQLRNELNALGLLQP